MYDFLDFTSLLSGVCGGGCSTVWGVQPPPRGVWRRLQHSVRCAASSPGCVEEAAAQCVVCQPPLRGVWRRLQHSVRCVSLGMLTSLALHRHTGSMNLDFQGSLALKKFLILWTWAHTHKYTIHIHHTQTHTQACFVHLSCLFLNHNYIIEWRYMITQSTDDVGTACDWLVCITWY